jgi:regulator of RNase E activity RraA
VAHGLRALTVARKVTGRVLTVQLGPVHDAPPGPPASATPLSSWPKPAGPRHLATAAIEAASRGDVIVLAAGGRLDAAAWGGVLSLAATLRGVGGVIIDGACRDVDSAVELELPVYALAATPLTARGRHAEVAWNVPVPVAGVAVHPGDLVIADGSGVVFLPAKHAARILDLAQEVAAAEDAMCVRIKRGEAVSRVMSADYERMLASDGGAS